MSWDKKSESAWNAPENVLRRKQAKIANLRARIYEAERRLCNYTEEIGAVEVGAVDENGYARCADHNDFEVASAVYDIERDQFDHEPTCGLCGIGIFNECDCRQEGCTGTDPCTCEECIRHRGMA